MKLVVGLGNPGKEYEKTRHNVGFMYIEHLNKKYNFSSLKEKYNAVFYEHTFNGEKVCFVKPTTYMNLSGEAILKLKDYFKIDIKDIIVIYDDIDIEFKITRYRDTGSAGTHNGMKNIVKLLSTTEIKRVRVGIGKPKYQNVRLDEYVLSNFSKEELLDLEAVFLKVDEKIQEFIDKPQK